MIIIIGLAFDIIGAWFIAYDIIWGYQTRVWTEFAKNRISLLKQDLQKLKNANINLCPPYSKEEIEKINEAVEKTYLEMIEEEENKIKNSNEKHHHKSVRFALIGIILLTIGFGLQIIGVLKA